MSEKRNPLFIPLKGEFYDAFNAGTKDTEYRLAGGRWNGRTCAVGRPVILSRGYGKARRQAGTVRAFTERWLTDLDAEVRDSLRHIYGIYHDDERIACIGIQVESGKADSAVESGADTKATDHARLDPRPEASGH